MFTCQLFNLMKSIDNGRDGSSLLMEIVTTHADHITDDIKKEMLFLLDSSMSGRFVVSKPTGTLLDVKCIGYHLTIKSLSWKNQLADVILDDVEYTAAVEKYKDFFAIICGGEVVAVINCKYII